MGFSIATGLVCALVFAAPIVASGSESLVLCEPCAKPCITDIGETPLCNCIMRANTIVPRYPMTGMHLVSALARVCPTTAITRRPIGK